MLQTTNLNTWCLLCRCDYLLLLLLILLLVSWYMSYQSVVNIGIVEYYKLFVVFLVTKW